MWGHDGRISACIITPHITVAAGERFIGSELCNLPSSNQYITLTSLAGSNPAIYSVQRTRADTS